MVDPRLNSIHLEAPRRQDFRRAREGLLAARGSHTLAAEHGSCDESDGPHTFVQEPLKAPPPDVMFWLVDRDCIHPLKIGLNTIGRSPDNDVILQDAYVSRRHCAILVHANGRVELHDIASKNGTFINGRKLAGPTKLNPGDEIRMCDRQLVLMTKDAQPDAAPEMPTLMG